MQVGYSDLKFQRSPIRKVRPGSARKNDGSAAARFESLEANKLSRAK